MAGDLSMPSSFATKAEMYKYIYDNLAQHLEALGDCHSKFSSQLNLVTALANAASLIYYAMNSYAVKDAKKYPTVLGSSAADDTAANNDANTAAADLLPPLHDAIVNWVGFYLIADAQYMVLGPFQGKVACTRIKIGKGVCGTAVLLGKTQCIPNVHEFPGHIACDSGSESEIVVPIRDNSGRIVGVLDIDSTVLSRFDQEDVMRLTDIVVLISQHVQFPNVAEQRGRNMEPLDGRGGVGISSANIVTVETKAPSATAAAEAVPSAAFKHAATIVRNPVVTAHPSSPTANGSGGGSPSDVVPQIKKKQLGDWEVTISRMDKIIAAGEITRWEEELKIACIPEIVFPANGIELLFTNQKTQTQTRLTINAETYFASATAFYKTRKAIGSEEQQQRGPGTIHAVDETYDAMKEEQAYLTIPVAESWKNVKFGQFDPNIDWASRSNYLCAVQQKKIGEDDAAGDVTQPRFERSFVDVVNYDMLKRRDLEILAYDSFDLFEDDLHDVGISKASVKVRVMPLCIFVLIRHVVRVDAAGAMCRDVRLYIELDQVQGVAGIVGKTPEKGTHVIAEVTYKHLAFPSSPVGLAPGSPQQQTRQVESTDKAHLRIPLDELVEQMQQTQPAKNYVLKL